MLWCLKILVKLIGFKTKSCQLLLVLGLTCKCALLSHGLGLKALILKRQSVEILRGLSIVPGLCLLMDEVETNSADNWQLFVADNSLIFGGLVASDISCLRNYCINLWEDYLYVKCLFKWGNALLPCFLWCEPRYIIFWSIYRSLWVNRYLSPNKALTVVSLSSSVYAWLPLSNSLIA